MTPMKATIHAQLKIGHPFRSLRERSFVLSYESLAHTRQKVLHRFFEGRSAKRHRQLQNGNQGGVDYDTYCRFHAPRLAES